MTIPKENAPHTPKPFSNSALSMGLLLLVWVLVRLGTARFGSVEREGFMAWMQTISQVVVSGAGLAAGLGCVAQLLLARMHQGTRCFHVHLWHAMDSLLAGGILVWGFAVWLPSQL